jgi:GR25 family glycosyltransferase involved in LPS biosynthesis
MLQDLRVYVINLDRRPDRWESAQKTLKKAGFKDIVRVSAVDGKLIDTDQLKRLVHPSVYNELGKIRKNHEDLGSLGAVGCYLSHLKVWTMIMERNQPAIVVEDDLECHPLFNEFQLTKNTQTLNKYDFVLLASHVREPHLLQKTSEKQGIVDYHGMFFLLHFYYLTPNGAKFFSKDALPIKYQVDSYMSFKIKKNTMFKSGVHKPDMAMQSDTVTDIQTMMEGTVDHTTYIILKTFKSTYLKLFNGVLIGLMIAILVLALSKIIKSIHE